MYSLNPSAKKNVCAIGAFLCASAVFAASPDADEPAHALKAISHNGGAATVDLGVGLWASPIPYDVNGDGAVDLFVVSCGSPAMKDVYYFENTGRADPKTGAPLFKKGVAIDPAKWKKGKRVSHAVVDVTPSYCKDKNGKTVLRVTSPKGEFPDFLNTGLAKPKPLPFSRRDIYTPSGNCRGESWNFVDWNGDGHLDLLIGIGDWTDYGWDAAYDENGRWRNGPLHGFVYVALNKGTRGSFGDDYEAPVQICADGRAIDVYGNPSPNFADFRGDGTMDLICGEFVDGFTLFQNVGTKESPKLLAGVPLRDEDGDFLKMHLEMIEPVAFDWNGDGRADLVVGQEDGRVALIRNNGAQLRPARLTARELRQNIKKPDQLDIKFSKPQFLRQEADNVKFGVLSCPVCADWDGDGLVDILTGNAAGEIAFIKNTGMRNGKPSFAEPELLCVDGKPVRYMAGVNGSIQGPAESKWGYTNIGVGDWDGDGLLDILVSTIRGKIYFHKNIGTKTSPKIAAGVPLEVEWDGPTPKPAWNWWNPEGKELVVHWRCTPAVIDIDGDGINDLVTVDHEGYLAWYRQVEKDGRRVLLPGRRIFGERDADGKVAPMLLSLGTDGSSGRRTYCFTDWDGDGKLDLLVNGPKMNAEFYKNVSQKAGEWVFENQGPVDSLRLAGHSTTPAAVDWNGDGIPDLLIGAEDGFFYYMDNPRTRR